MLTERTSRPTAFALAFEQAAFRVAEDPARESDGAIDCALVALRALNNGRGQVKERTTDARLSYRTAMKLKHQGIIE